MKLKSNKNIQYGIIYTVSNTVQKGIGFLVFMYFASILSVKEYASFGLNYSFFSIVCMFSYAGINESVIGWLKQENKIKKLFKSANSVFLLYSFTSFLLFIPVYKIIYIDSDISILNLISIILGAVLLSFFTFQSIIVRLKEQHIQSVIYSFFPPILAYMLGFYLVFITKQGVSYFQGVLYASIISIFGLLILRRYFIGFSNSKRIIKKIITSSLPYIAIAFFAWILGYGNTFLINYLFEDIQVATYVFLYTIASILQLVANSMNQVWSPRFYKIYKEAQLKEIENKYSLFTTVQGVVIGVFGALIILCFPIITSYFDSLSKFENVELPMMFLFGGYIVSIPWWHTQNYYMINSKGKELMNLTLVSGLIGLLFWIGLMIVFKEKGIYLGFFVQLLIRSLLVFFYGKKIWKIKFDWKGIILGLSLLLLAVLINYKFYGL